MGDVMSSELITTNDAITATKLSIADVEQIIKSSETVKLVTPSIDHEKGKDDTIEIKYRHRKMKGKVKIKLSLKKNIKAK